MTEEKIQQADLVHLAAPGSLSALRAASKVSACPEVKPCPFCGHVGVSVFTPGDSFRYRAAMCNGCGAQAEDVRIQTTGDGTPDEWEQVAHARAIAAWNRRAPTGQSRTSETARSAPSYASPSDETTRKVALDIAKWFVNGDRPDEFKLKEWAEALHRDAVAEAFALRSQPTGERE